MVWCQEGTEMKITFRIWLLTFSLAIASILIINGSTTSRLLSAFLIIMIPFMLSKVNSSAGRIVVFLVLIGSLIFIISTAAQPGVEISSIEKNSSEFDAGLRNGMVINSINGQDIENLLDYTNVVGDMIFVGEEKVIIKTRQSDFFFLSYLYH